MQKTMTDAAVLIGESFGHALRQEREARSRSLAWLSAETKVGVRHLQALEQGQFEELPGGIFRRGIIRAYLKAVGLDEQHWLPRFQQILEAQEGAAGQSAGEEAWEQFAENVRRGRGYTVRQPNSLKWLGVAALLGSMLLAAWAVWHFQIRPRQQLRLTTRSPAAYPADTPRKSAPVKQVQIT